MANSKSLKEVLDFLSAPYRAQNIDGVPAVYRKLNDHSASYDLKNGWFIAILLYAVLLFSFCFVFET